MKKPLSDNERQFKKLFLDRFVQDKFNGYDLKLFQTLDEEAQVYLLEFIRDSCAIQRPNKDSFKILNSEMVSEAWRERKNFYRQQGASNGIQEYKIGAEYDLDLSSDPESLLIQKDITERYEKQKLNLVKKKS